MMLSHHNNAISDLFVPFVLKYKIGNDTFEEILHEEKL